MLPTFLPTGQKRLLSGLVAVGMFPLALAAQYETDPEKTVQVALEGFTLEPERDDTGAPVLNEAGEPIMQRIMLDESVITPGDQVLYVITVTNPTEESALNLQLGLQVAPELLLDPYGFVGPEGLIIDWADVETPDIFAPLFVEIEGETVMQADLDALGALRLTLSELPSAEEIHVEYTVTLR